MAYTRPRSTRPVRAIADPAKMYRLRKLRGLPGRVPVDRARAHVAGLLELGLKPESIARAAGISRHVVDRLAGPRMDPTQKLIDHRTQAALLAVTWRPHPRQAVCLAIGAQRRAYALARMGWSLSWQAEQIGQRIGNYARSLTNPRISYPTWAAIRDLYEAHAMRPGPHRHAALLAEQAGWLPPLAWDDDTIDDPAAQPADTGTGRRALVHLDDVAWLIEDGATWHSLPTRLGVTKDAIEKACHRADRRDLLEQLTRNTKREVAA